MNICPIWGTPCESVKRVDPRLDRLTVKGSLRAGGDYRIKSEQDIYELGDEAKARLTTWLIDQRNQGIQSPRIGVDEVDHAVNSRPLPVHERADRLLKFLEENTTHVGDHVWVMYVLGSQAKQSSTFLSALAWSESTDRNELSFLLNYLQERGWVKDLAHGNFVVTVDGYARIGEQDTASDPSLCFVAMWFGDSMRLVYDEAIAPAIRDAGYEPRRIDDEHGLIDRIDDAIVAEIRRSRFLVVDWTHGDDGVRGSVYYEGGSVYYEAGLAHGLEKPVVFICREDHINDIQFDTRQYNTIGWAADDLPSLRQRLTDRILESARIGRGPL